MNSKSPPGPTERPDADTRSRRKQTYGRLSPYGSGDTDQTIPLEDSDGSPASAPSGAPVAARPWPARDKAIAGLPVQPVPAPSAVPPQVPRSPSFPPPPPPPPPRPSPVPQPAAAPQTTITAAAAPVLTGPVAGWLVVVAGPGRGRSFEIVPGVNAIGSQSGQQIAVAFGDPEIAPARHALVIFDPRSTRFFLQNGESGRLTYLDNDVVLTPVALSGGERIGIGATELLFVPLCGPEFSWSGP